MFHILTDIYCRFLRYNPGIHGMRVIAEMHKNRSYEIYLESVLMY